MTLEDAGKMEISKSGKGVLLTVESVHIGAFKYYLVASLKDVKDLVAEKRAFIPLKIIVSSE